MTQLEVRRRRTMHDVDPAAVWAIVADLSRLSDWLPVFPPLEMISGTKNTSHFQLSNCRSYPFRAKAVTSAKRKRTASQMPRFQLSVTKLVRR